MKILDESRLNKRKSECERSACAPQNPFCPICRSLRVWKDGLRYGKGRPLQRWLCRDCGRRFSESSFESHVQVNVFGQTDKFPHSNSEPSKNGVGHPDSTLKEAMNRFLFSSSKDITSQVATTPFSAIIAQDINTFPSYNSTRQVCVLEPEAKNLSHQRTRQKRAAGATTSHNEANAKGKIIEYMWYMKKQGYAETTIKTYLIILKVLRKRGANLYDPESVKEVIALQENWGKGRKWNVVKAYSLFLKMHGLTWEKPRYKPVEKLPFIPTEREIDELIAGCSKQMATFLQVLKETGARRGEAFNLKWADIDFVSGTLRITPEKGSNPRVFKISSKLAGMLSNLPKTSNRIWIYKRAYNLEKGFRRQRKRVANKLGNPRILQIHCHTLRHWKATTEYAKTKDILYVQKLLGHKNLKTTLRYTQLVDLPQNEEYVCKATKTIKEAKELVEAGFEYVTDMDGCKLFRKRKNSYLGG